MRWEFCDENEFVFLSQYFNFENVYINYLHFNFYCFTFSLWTKIMKTFFRSLNQSNFKIMNKLTRCYVYAKKKMSFFRDEKRSNDFVAMRTKHSRIKRKFIENRKRRRIFQHIMSKKRSFTTKFRKWFVRDVQSFYLISLSIQITQAWLII